MYWFELTLAIVSFAGLLYGFSKNDRKILFIAGIALFVAGSSGDFVHGFKDGLKDAAPPLARQK